MQSECDGSGCNRTFDVSTLITVPSKLLIQWKDANDVDEEDGTMHESYTAVAPSQLCRQCRGKYRATEISNIQSLSFVSMTSFGTPAFDQHVKT